MIKLSVEEATTRLETLRVEYKNWFNAELHKEHLEALLRKHLDRIQEKFLAAYLDGSDAIQTLDLLEFLNPKGKEIKEDEADANGAPRKKGGRANKGSDNGLGELGSAHSDAGSSTNS